MFTRRLIKAAGAVVTVAALGQLPAHAAVNLDNGTGAVTYARETLTGVVGTTAYYEVRSEPAGLLSLEAAVGRTIGASGGFQVKFLLDDMVFGADLGDSDLTIAGDSSPTISKLTGGTVGSNEVVYTIAATSDGIASGAMMTLKVTHLGIHQSKPGKASMGTRLWTGSLNTGPPFERFTRPVRTVASAVSALRESAAPASPIVKFADGFRAFSDGSRKSLMASVGQISIGPEEGLLIAATSTAASLDNMSGATDPGVTFTGTIDFAQKAFLSTKADCSSEVADTTLTKDASGVTVWKVSADAGWPVPLATADDKHLCIEVNGTTSIPETVAYKATVSYGGGITGAVFPPGSADLELGQVLREGTTVSLPYVNTNPRFIFRIVIMNKGSESAPYQFEFKAPKGDVGSTTATARAKATGTVAGNSTKILNATEVVEVEGHRTATGATLTVGAPRENLEVMTVQVNRSDGSTDSESYIDPVE